MENLQVSVRSRIMPDGVRMPRTVCLRGECAPVERTVGMRHEADGEVYVVELDGTLRELLRLPGGWYLRPAV